MKFRKSIAASALSLALVISSSAGAFASAPAQTLNKSTSASETNVVQPRVYWQGEAFLSATNWCNITSSNNIFADSPLVTNRSNNAGPILVRIINERGEQVGGVKGIPVGTSVRLDKIPALSGTYTLQGQSARDGMYSITIDS